MLAKYEFQRRLDLLVHVFFRDEIADIQIAERKHRRQSIRITNTTCFAFGYWWNMHETGCLREVNKDYGATLSVSDVRASLPTLNT